MIPARLKIADGIALSEASRRMGYALAANAVVESVFSAELECFVVVDSDADVVELAVDDVVAFVVVVVGGVPRSFFDWPLFAFLPPMTPPTTAPTRARMTRTTTAIPRLVYQKG